MSTLNRSFIYVEVPQDVIDRLSEQLKEIPEKMPDALRKTINGVAKHTRKELPNRVRKVYTLKHAAKRVKESSEFESARGKQFQATILIKGRPEPLLDFNVRKQGKRVSAKAKVLQTSQLGDLTLIDGGKRLKAFVQKITNEDKQGNETHHVGVFRRMTDKEKGEQQNYFDEQAKKGKKQKTTKRNAIKQLYSTSVPQMVKNDKIYPQIEKDIKEELRSTLDKHIKAVMEGMR